MLEFFILIFDRRLEPIFRIQIQRHPALVEAMTTFGKIGFGDKGKELFFCFHLQNRSVIVSEMIVGPLPKVRMRGGHNFDAFLIDAVVPGFPDPFHFRNIKHFCSL